MLKSKAGRAELFKAWYVYQELSRRILLPDRFPKNTALVLQQAEGLSLTFQPLDLDGVGSFIGADPSSGAPRFTEFDKDFGYATGKLLLEILSAREKAPPEEKPDFNLSTLLAELFSGEASLAAAIPANLPGVYATINRILDENDGIPAG